MRFLLLFLLTTLCTGVYSQSIHRDADVEFKSQNYISFNPFGLLEEQMAIGLGFGNRFTPRSEYFTELSYLTKSKSYQNVTSLKGWRFIGQYRFYFTPLAQKARPTEGARCFLGAEFRTKQYDFADSLSFINGSTNDTLLNYPYRATASVLGGAVLFGVSNNLSANGRLRFEFTFGFGIKGKSVRFNDVPKGYQRLIVRPIEWAFFPKIYESASTVYFPSTVRIQYRIR